jgi:Ala-tRNA(Pro) deacylase
MATRRLTEFLDGHRVKYVIVHHSPAFTAQEVAASSHISGHRMAKTVVVKIDHEFALAVVRATDDVDMLLLSDVAGTSNCELAAQDEFVDRFEGCEIGAIPPFGTIFGLPTYVDTELSKEAVIAFNAGSHSAVAVMDWPDYRRLARPKIASIAFEPSTAASQPWLTL